MTEKYFSSLERQSRRENYMKSVDIIDKTVMFVDVGDETLPH